MRSNSPLRYPGGKAVLTAYLAQLIDRCQVRDCIYVEPYAGGAGAALNLLLLGSVSKIILNDADRSVYAIWWSILNRTEELIELIEKTPINVATWKKQRKIYFSTWRRPLLELGFSAFFLNRCNRSGIIANGGMIGGISQNGKWKIDARFNKVELVRRIRTISNLRDKIEIYNRDALDFIRARVLTKRDRKKFLIYLDPPYYEKGSRLYLNCYQHTDHASLAALLRRISNLKWVASYDNVDQICDLYSWCNSCNFTLGYSAHTVRLGNEVMFFSDDISDPCPEILLQSA